MTPQARIRRIGWFAALAVCTALYLMLHLKVHSVRSDVVRAERRIVQLEQQNMLLETEYLTRSSQLQLARWNRIDFGYTAPEAAQFIKSERQLAMFSVPPAGPARPAGDSQGSIQFASLDDAGDAAPTPRLVSPLTGEPLDEALLAPAASEEDDGPRMAMVIPQGPQRIELSAVAGAAIR